MNSSPSDIDPEDSGPLTYEPEFAYWSQDDDASNDSSGETSAGFGGLPDLDDSKVVSDGLPVLDEETPDLGDSLPVVAEESDEFPPNDSDSMSFDDGFSTGLEDLDFTDYTSDDEVNSEPETEEDSDSPDLSEFTDGLEPDVEDESDDEEDIAEPNDDNSDEDEDDGSSLGEIAKTVGSALAIGGKKGLEVLQKILSKLPLVGKLVTNAVRAGVTLVLLVAVPVALIVVSSAIVRASTAPSETVTISLPDNGSVAMSKMVLSDDGDSLTATLTNTGDVIADVTPNANLKAVVITSPISWYKRADVGSCTGEMVTVDIEASTDVTLKCTTSDEKAIPEGVLQ